jgi:hypothetical protein
MESFKSRQFAANEPSKPSQPMKLNSYSRRLYPELSSLLDLQAKQEKLRKLQNENRFKGAT